MFDRRITFLTLFFGMAVFAMGEEAVMEKTDAALPDEVSAEMKAVLPEQAYAVSLDGALVANLWVRPEVPRSASASSELGVAFGSIEPGSLLGLFQIVGSWSDYKGNPIHSGVYTLRYQVMPADGNHMGVSVYRDFVLLLSAKVDTDPEEKPDFASSVALSAEAVGVPHPGVLALFPIWDEISEPSLVKNEVDQWTVAFKVGEEVMGLVVKGEGEH